MAGGIRIREDGRFWTIRSSIFSWIVDQLAEEVADADLAAELRQISEQNLGSLDVDRGHTPGQRQELRSALARLPQIGEAQLPETDGKAAVLAHLRELAALVLHDRRGD